LVDRGTARLVSIWVHDIGEEECLWWNVLLECKT
jgi:hypothetical protein